MLFQRFENTESEYKSRRIFVVFEIMKTADFNNRLTDAYLELLKNLDPNSKLDLISKLTKSIKSDLKDKKMFSKRLSVLGTNQKVLKILLKKSETVEVLIEKLKLCEAIST